MIACFALCYLCCHNSSVVCSCSAPVSSYSDIADSCFADSFFGSCFDIDCLAFHFVVNNSVAVGYYTGFVADNCFAVACYHIGFDSCC